MKSTTIRGMVVAIAVLVMSALLGACGSDAGGGEDGAELSGKIAFLMPDRASTRYEKQDYPLFKAKVEDLCPDCSVLYQNADSDAEKQLEQADSAIAQGVEAIVIDAVDTKAA